MSKPNTIPDSDLALAALRGQWPAGQRLYGWQRMIQRDGRLFVYRRAGPAQCVCRVRDYEEFMGIVRRDIDIHTTRACDFAASINQILGNAGRTQAFQMALAEEIAGTTRRWAMMLPLFDIQ